MSNLEWRPSQFHPEAPPELRLGGSGAFEPRQLLEEHLDLRRRVEHEDDAARPIADVVPGVRNTARAPDRVARLQEVPVLPDLHHELPLPDKEPLILQEVDMPRRSAFRPHQVLGHEQLAAIGPSNLVSEGADAQIPDDSIPILP